MRPFAPARTHTRKPVSYLASILVAGLAATVISLPSAAAATAPTEPATTAAELLSNPDFDQGSTGWRTNGNNATLEIIEGSTNIAELTTTTRGNATLNDAPNTVQSTTEGTSYVATARVRTTSPIVNGALRIREVGPGAVTSYQSSFNLRTTQWQTITLEVTTAYPQSHLDLNLTAWHLPAGHDLQVEWVSLKEAGTDSPAPEDVAPPTDTLFGSSVSTVGKSLEESLDEVDGDFGQAPVIRHFSPGLPFSWDSYPARELSDRTLVLSFKTHPTEITSGRLDSFFRNWFATAPTDQTIYWSYFHEPENNINAGEFTEAQYRAAWARLGRLADEVSQDNMFSTLILTSWTMNPQSGRDYEAYDAGPDAVDVIAFDPYNGIWDPERDYYEAPDQMLGNIVSTMEADGRPWGIAEIGSRIVVGDDGTGRAAWLRSIGEYAAANDALFVTYFHSIGNADWRLLDAPSRNAWASLVSS